MTPSATPRPLSDAAREFLRRPAPCVVSTLGKHGQPVSVATWYLLQDDDTVLMNIEAGRVRIDHMRRDPRIAMTVMGQDNWYSHVSVQGHVTDIHADPDMSVIDRISAHYTGKPYAVRDKQRISVVAAIDRWFPWNLG